MTQQTSAALGLAALHLNDERFPLFRKDPAQPRQAGCGENRAGLSCYHGALRRRSLCRFYVQSQYIKHERYGLGFVTESNPGTHHH